MSRFIIASTVLGTAIAGMAAKAAPVDDYSAKLYAGDIAAAVTVAREWVAGAPDDGAALFALGVAQFLVAVENLGHGLYRYGLRSDYDLGEFGGLAGAPFVRLPVPHNPNPEQITFEAFNGLLIAFSDDSAVAEAVLDRVGPTPFQLSLDLSQLGFDFNRDGISDDNEDLLGVFFATSSVPKVFTTETVDLDETDAPWLQG